MKVISFFSYKGGAGRSTLAYNIIPILAQKYYRPTKESPMIVIDTDVDSCGMSYLLEAENKIEKDNCVQHLLGEPFYVQPAASIKEHPFLSKLIPVGNAYGYPDNEAILLLPAFDNKAISAGEKSNYNGSEFAKDNMEKFLKTCRRFFKVPAVIIDSAVGNNATANVSNEVSDVIVCCMRPTTQFVNGTKRFLLALEKDNADGIEAEMKNMSETDIVLVPNVIPPEEISINGVQYPETAKSKIQSSFITPDFMEGSRHKYHLDLLDWDCFGIPAVERFMWKEDILFCQDPDTLTKNDQLALSRYKRLADIIYNIELRDE
ncbi:MAG: ParA family protein [Clostridia bacterium]|nr:ParA family protein [Clostridia bacterium]